MRACACRACACVRECVRVCAVWGVRVGVRVRALHVCARARMCVGVRVRVCLEGKPEGPTDPATPGCVPLPPTVSPDL